MTLIRTVLILVTLVLFGAACRQPDPNENLTLPTVAPPAPTVNTDSEDKTVTSPSISARHSDVDKVADNVAIEIVSTSEEPIGLQMPAYLEVEIAGRGITEVVHLAGMQQEDGHHRLISYSPLMPPKINGRDEAWHDGIHELVNIWNAEGDYLSDGSVGEFVILLDAEAGNSLQTIHGQFRAAEENNFFDVILVVDENNYEIVDVIDTSTDRQVIPGLKDEFRITNLLLLSDAAIAPESGTSLFFDEAGQLYLERRPLPGGEYFAGLLVETESGSAKSALVDFTVGNENLLSGYRAFFDPARGFQFLYPEAWNDPVLTDNRISTSNISNTLQLNVTVHPNLDQKTIADLRRKVLSTFGQVQILYEDTIQMGAVGAYRTAYGYEAADGPHTGVFLIVAQEGNAFVIDVDGAQAIEESVLDVAATLSESWVNRQVSLGQDPGQWQQITIDGLDLHVPSDYQYTKLNNDWHRFTASDDTTFIALKSEATSSGRILDRIRHWLEVAGKNVNEFAYSEFYTFKLVGRDWLRVDFSYNDEDQQQVMGTVMATRVGDQLLFSWAEANTDGFDYLDKEILLLMQSDIRQIEQ